MRLVAFRVQNYKKIGDTGWITVADPAAFVGKNEAGKSALFRGLSKLNPSDGETYDGLKEFPRRRYTDEFKQQDWPVASGRFELSDHDCQELASIWPALSNCTQVVCTRHYSWYLDVEFEPALDAAQLTRKTFRSALEDLEQKVSNLTAPEGKGDALGTMKQQLLQLITNIKSQQASRSDSEVVKPNEVVPLRDLITTQSNEQWQKEVLADLLRQVEQLSQEASFSEQLQNAKQWVERNLPMFIYFDRYDVIDSAIHLPTLFRNLITILTLVGSGQRVVFLNMLGLMYKNWQISENMSRGSRWILQPSNTFVDMWMSAQ